MKRSRQVTAALVIAVFGAAFGVAACSKSDDTKQASPKPLEPVQAETSHVNSNIGDRVQAIDEEGFVAKAIPEGHRVVR